MKNAGRKKPFNVRIPVLTACSLALGIAFAYLLLYFKLSLLWIIAVIPVAAIIFILLTVFTGERKNIIILTLITAFFVAGTLNCYLRLDNYSKQLNEGQLYGFSATVCERGENYIVIESVTADGKPVRGKIKVYLGDYYGDFCDTGYKVKFISDVERYDLFAYGKINYNVQDDIRYRCTVYGGLKAEYSFSLFGTIRAAIKDVLYDNLDKNSAAIAYAMLTGNTYGVDEGSLQTFRYGGIAHIFAVSGLHIGIVYGIISFICKKTRTNRYLFAGIAIFTVAFYSGICGFTVSSVRAAIMCAIAALSKIFRKKYDGFNSLSVGALLILSASPVSLFSVGFQLTLCAVAGILLLSKKLTRPFKKIPRKLKEPVAVSLSAQAGTMPVMLVNFGYLSGAGILLNVVLVPVLSLTFALLFSGTFISLIIPPAARFILPYAALPVEAVVSFLLNAGFERALIKGFGAGLFLPLYFLIILLLSDKLNMKLIYRAAAVATAAIVTASYVLIKTFFPFGGFQITVSAYYGGGEVLIKSGQGNVLILTEGLITSRLNIFISEYYSSSLDAVIILGGEDCVSFYGDCNLSCKNVYVYYGYIDIQPYTGVTVNYEKTFEVGGAEFEFTDGYSVKAALGGVNIGVCAGENMPFTDCDLLIGDCAFGYTDAVGFNNRNVLRNVYDDGDYVFKVNNGLLK